jgi:hypothetical protein
MKEEALWKIQHNWLEMEKLFFLREADVEPRDYPDWIPLQEQSIDTKILFDNYYCVEGFQIYYDSELLMNEKFSSNRLLYYLFRKTKAYKEYDRNDRLLINNWLEMIAEGCWGMDQEQVDNIAKIWIEEAETEDIYKDCRVNFLFNENELLVTIFMRDIDSKRYDLLFHFKRKKEITLIPFIDYMNLIKDIKEMAKRDFNLYITISKDMPKEDYSISLISDLIYDLMANNILSDVHQVSIIDKKGGKVIKI